MFFLHAKFTHKIITPPLTSKQARIRIPSAYATRFLREERERDPVLEYLLQHTNQGECDPIVCLEWERDIRQRPSPHATGLRPRFDHPFFDLRPLVSERLHSSG